MSLSGVNFSSTGLEFSTPIVCYVIVMLMRSHKFKTDPKQIQYDDNALVASVKNYIVPQTVQHDYCISLNITATKQMNVTPFQHWVP